MNADSACTLAVMAQTVAPVGVRARHNAKKEGDTMRKDAKDAKNSLPGQENPDASKNSANATGTEANGLVTSFNSGLPLLQEYLIRPKNMESVEEDENIEAIILESIISRLTGDHGCKIAKAWTQDHQCIGDGQRIQLELFGKDAQANLCSIEIKCAQIGTKLVLASRDDPGA